MHEGVVRMLLSSATPPRDEVHGAITDIVDPPGAPRSKAPARKRAAAVVALRMKVALGVLAESMLSVEFQEAFCRRYVPAAFGGAALPSVPC